MEQKLSRIIQNESQITYSYATIRITQSRIDKGLIAIPVSLTKWFPDHNYTIEVYLNDSPNSQIKHYSSYNSSTRECRIGGMRQWFQQNNIKTGDEIVIQLLNKKRFVYRLIPERNFILKTKELQQTFDNSATEQEASEKITTLSDWTHSNKDTVVLNEYYRLVNTLPYEERRHIEKRSSRRRESVPANLRNIIEDIYRGHCQACDFWFLRKDKKPYFEFHHINPFKGHHPKNLLVVCGNCHNQFEYAEVKPVFSKDGWLVKVSFNNRRYSINHAILKTKIKGFFKELFI
jgi:uncharacterized CHY-type Zn-finger protein